MKGGIRMLMLMGILGGDGGCGIWSLEFGVWFLEFGVWFLEEGG